jgi:hypothetical protein
VTGRKCESIEKEASKIDNGVIACLGIIVRNKRDGINQAYIDVSITLSFSKK